MTDAESLKFFGNKHPFSNFAPYPLTIGGKTYLTPEHYFQAAKFIDTDPNYAEEIRLAATPGIAKKLGKSRKHVIDPDWNNNRIKVMGFVIFTKVLQYPDFLSYLVSTGDKILIEASPFDAYWGDPSAAGRKKKGKNMLGKVYMCLRHVLKDYEDTIYVSSE